MQTLIILDPGHGVDTPGKRSPVDMGLPQLMEWQFNRLMMNKFIQKVAEEGLAFNITCEGAFDVPIRDRTMIANRIYNDSKRQFDNIFGISFHGNAYSDKAVKGSEIYTYFGQTDSDVLAEFIARKWKKDKHIKFRPDIGDGDLDKEANMAILRDTISPFILLEYAYYTNKFDLDDMFDNDWQEHITQLTFEGTMQYIEWKESI